MLSVLHRACITVTSLNCIIVIVYKGWIELGCIGYKPLPYTLCRGTYFILLMCGNVTIFVNDTHAKQRQIPGVKGTWTQHVCVPCSKKQWHGMDIRAEGNTYAMADCCHGGIVALRLVAVLHQTWEQLALPAQKILQISNSMVTVYKTLNMYIVITKEKNKNKLTLFSFVQWSRWPSECILCWYFKKQCNTWWARNQYSRHKCVDRR